MLSQQRNPCTDCKSANSAQLEAPHTIPQVTFGSMHSGIAAKDRQTNTVRETDGRGKYTYKYTFRLGYASREM